MIRRTTREGERIDYGDGSDQIPAPLADRLRAFARTTAFSGRGGDGVLDHGRKGLRARGIVGEIGAPGVQLEILPKIEGVGETKSPSTALRARLVERLALAHDRPIEAGRIAPLAWPRGNRLEILITLFCKRRADALRQGLPRAYLRHAEDLPALLGQFDAVPQFSLRAAAPEKLACRFDALSPDIALNRVMRAALAKLVRISVMPDTQRRLRERVFADADVTEVPPSALPWGELALDRPHGFWRDFLRSCGCFCAIRIRRHGWEPSRVMRWCSRCMCCSRSMSCG